jgi:quercetin dioxygenase-like cupin family protein
MDDGQEFRIKAGDAFHIPPGHDAWVDGDETCVLLDIGGYSDYAKAKKAA